MIARVLVPVDGSELSEHALPYAVRVASAARSVLVLMYAHLPIAVRKEPPYDLAPLAARLRSQGLEVETVVRHAHRDETADVIQQVARDQGAGLIVMATHGRGGLGRWIYGSVADKVLRQATVPVLLVPSTPDHAWPTDRPLRVLVPLDGSTFAEEAVAPAAELASVLGANLMLIRAVPTDPRPIFPDHGSLAPVVPRVDEATARSYLRDVAAELTGVAGTVDLRVALGPPATLIARTARTEQIDLIAMTTRARGGVSRWALGSVATDTLRRARLPMLLIRPTALRREEAAMPPIAQAVAAVPPTNGSVAVTLSPHEQEVICEALELLIYSTHGDPAMVHSVREVLQKVRPTEPATPAGAGR